MTIDVDTLIDDIAIKDAPRELPDPNLDTAAPPDKEPQARDEEGKFKGEPGKAPEAKDQQQPDPKADQQQQPPPNQQQQPRRQGENIPLAAYLEDKRTWQTEKQALLERLQRLENPPKAPPPEPAFEDDPKGYTDHKVNSALEQLKQQTAAHQQQLQQVTQTTQQTREQAELIAFSTQLQTAEAAFVKQNPDYFDALDHVRGIRAQQLRLMVPDITDQQIEAQIGQEELQMSMQLARSGRNPIATVYQLAQSYGYQKKAPQGDGKGGDVLQLPNVPGQRQLPPDQTLGSGASGQPQGGDDQGGDQKDAFEEAFAELFGKRKRA
jgi:hypothetical protein